jgi:predicted DNA-binding transcriptional regulator AlpA
MTAAEELRKALERAAAELTPEEARALLGPLLATVLERAVQPSPQPMIAAPDPLERKGERTLTVAETAARFGRSRWWIYQHQGSLPGRVPLPGGGFGFREKSIERWIQRRARNDT